MSEAWVVTVSLQSRPGVHFLCQFQTRLTGWLLSSGDASFAVASAQVCLPSGMRPGPKRAHVVNSVETSAMSTLALSLYLQAAADLSRFMLPIRPGCMQQVHEAPFLHGCHKVDATAGIL